MSTRGPKPTSGPALFEAPPEPLFEPRILAGLDEAGLGPMLGPLTIGMSAFRVVDAPLCLWKKLAVSCARDIQLGDERVVVADSKVVFTRTDCSARRLERTVLAFDALRAHDGRPRPHARAFLEAAALADVNALDLALESWWPALPHRLARETDEEDLRLTAVRLANTTHAARVELAGLWVRAVPAAALNRAFARTDNKSLAHWETCAPFLLELWTRFGSEGVDVVVDRHGGRMRYASLLRATFAGTRVETLAEAPIRSAYMIADKDGRALRVTFAEKSESFSFAVALASCAAKYAREVCMAAFNAYFLALEPALVPTAGYYNDARRWLADAGPAIERSGLARETIVRSR